jgi:hypothetical protein
VRRLVDSEDTANAEKAARLVVYLTLGEGRDVTGKLSVQSGTAGNPSIAAQRPSHIRTCSRYAESFWKSEHRGVGE